MTALSDLLAACEAVAADSHAARSTKTMAAALRAWAPSVQPPAPSPSPSPAPPPVPVGALLFSDDFVAAPLQATKWDVKIGAHSGSGTTFTPSAVAVANGALTITATLSAGKWYSGLIQSLAPAYSYSGPRYMEVVAQVPAGFGTWAAPLWEYDAPYGGQGIENDVCEQLGREPSVYHATIHNGPGSTNEVGRAITAPAAAQPLSAGFHRYGCAIDAAGARYFIDGALVATIAATQATGWPFVTTPMVCLIGLDMGGWGGTPTIPGPARLVVQSVNVWALA